MSVFSGKIQTFAEKIGQGTELTPSILWLHYSCCFPLSMVWATCTLLFLNSIIVDLQCCIDTCICLVFSNTIFHIYKVKDEYIYMLFMSMFISMHVCVLSHLWLFVTPWTVAHQAPPSMGFSRQEYWSGLLFPTPGDLLDPGIELVSPALEADSLPLGHQRSPIYIYIPTIPSSHSCKKQEGQHLYIFFGMVNPFSFSRLWIIET